MLSRAIRQICTSTNVSRSGRRFCTAVDANAALRASVAQNWDALIDAEWVDNEQQIPAIKEAEATIEKYRSVYDGTQDKLYESVKKLYEAKEAAKVCELYAEHIEHLIRDHEDITGPLGNNIEIPEDKVQPTLQTMKEYMEFVESVENDRVARKIEAQLGRKVLILRMALSIENFSVHFAPVAGDRMLVKDRISKTE